jgi:hypothetical protein
VSGAAFAFVRKRKLAEKGDWLRAPRNVTSVEKSRGTVPVMKKGLAPPLRATSKSGIQQCRGGGACPFFMIQGDARIMDDCPLLQRTFVVWLNASQKGGQAPSEVLGSSRQFGQFRSEPVPLFVTPVFTLSNLSWRMPQHKQFRR